VRFRQRQIDLAEKMQPGFKHDAEERAHAARMAAKRVAAR
tara:strand:+ start:252 stop:371 length:120 start_codon:yes stop_codon:yes gene_type:complete